MNSDGNEIVYKQAKTFERKITNEEKTYIISSIGKTINQSVEHFMTIGELIVKDFPEIKSEMRDCFKDAKDASKSIERLCKISTIDDINYSDLPEVLYDQNAIVLASRSLLSSITRVLLLVDIVIVKQLLATKRKIVKSLKRLESVLNFTEFVRSYSLFGIEMIELAAATAPQRNCLKEERRRAQMHAAQQILEKSIVILLTSAKTSLIHFQCPVAKENRDTVFCQIRRAMDLIHFVIKDSIFDSTWMSCSEQYTYRNIEKGTVYSTLKLFMYLMETFRIKIKHYEKSLSTCNNNGSRIINPLSLDTNCSNGDRDHGMFSISETDLDLNEGVFYEQRSLLLFSSDIRGKLLITFEKLLEKIHDFTDSAYTSHENRENILRLCEQCQIALRRCLDVILKNENYLTIQFVDEEVDSVLFKIKKLSEQLFLSVSDQVIDLNCSIKMSIDIVHSLHSLAIKQDISRLKERSNIFHDYCDHIIEVSKLLRHIAFNESLQVQAKCLTINLRIYGPQVLTAARILAKFPTSAPANENFEAFIELWKWLSGELSTMSKKILDSTNDIQQLKTESASSSEKSIGDAKPPLNANVVSADPYKNAVGTTDIKDESNELNLLNDKWNDDLSENNDILKRAKNMSAMAFSMYQFTKGSGNLRTTQDLFTQAEYFAEEANRLYKVLRQFSYQVPASDHKKELLNNLDRVPTFVQALQFTVKDHTVGKAATFVKVDHVIRETKNLMNAISKVVTKCFECANKYKLDFNSLSGRVASGTLRGEENNAGGMGDSKGTTNSTEGSIPWRGMARRAKGDARRTRVSFLLF